MKEFAIYATGNGKLQWRGYAKDHETAVQKHLNDLGYHHKEIDSGKVYDIQKADYVVSEMQNDDKGTPVLTDTVYVSVKLNLNK